MNIAMFLQMAAEACPDRLAVCNPDGRYSYQQLFQAAQRAASQIRASDCAYVSVLDTSSAAIPIALMGAAMAGRPYVPLNYRLTAAELDALMDRITPAFLVSGDAHLQHYSNFSGTHVVSRQDFLAAALQGNEALLDDADWSADPAGVAVQLFTSGTTGKPKAAILRHEHLVSYILGTIEFMGAAEEEATLVSVPPYHIAGISAVMSSIYACRRIVQLPDFNAAQWLQLAADENVSNAFVVPTMLTRIIDELKQASAQPDLSNLGAIAYGGGKMPGPVIEQALQLMPSVNFTNAYGLTETSSTITLLDPDDHRQAAASDDPNVRKRLGSVGKALPAVEIEVRDDDGNVLPANEAGEIFVRGPQVSGEYLERNALIADGWFPTRDAGYLDDEGYLFLSGRADDVIVRGGENISPSEIEDVLLTHDAIADAAAVAMPSEQWGETVAAFVVLKNGATVSPEELQAMVKDELRSSRVPEVIRFEEELPYNETGKLLRRVLKAHFDNT